MDRPPPSKPHPQQQMKLDRSSVSGQIGMAGDDLIQIQGSGNWVNKFVFYLFGRREVNHRRLLLNKVRKFWIQGVLERSLYQKARIELGLEERFDVIDLAWVTTERSKRLLPKGTKAIDKFDELGSGRTLLVLGEPSSGKTTTLLEIARELIDRAEQDESLPIPVVFNLSSWTAKETISEWLVTELKTKYGASKTFARSLIETQQLLLLMDGFDELKVEYRESGITAINQFNQKYEHTEIVICSRVKDYESLSRRLFLQAALLIQPLTLEQINEYLEQAGSQLSGVRTALQEDPVLQEIVRSPLMLSIAALVYQRVSATEIPKVNYEEQKQHLFDAYIRRMLRQRRSQRYDRKKAIRWLIWLSQIMVQNSQTTFLIEQIQPDLLQIWWQKWLYPLGQSLILGFIFGIPWIIAGFSSGSPGMGLSLAVLSWPMYYLACLIASCKPSHRIEPVETVKWSWKKATRKEARSGLGCFNIMFLIFVGVTIAFSPTTGLIFCVIFGFIFARLLILAGEGLDTPELDLKVSPNQGIRKSAINALKVFVVLLVFPFSVVTFGPAFVLRCGGAACLQHVILRIILFISSYTPWNYARFLDWATDLLFLQKIGGGYIFTHRLLMEHFAQLKIEK